MLSVTPPKAVYRKVIATEERLRQRTDTVLNSAAASASMHQGMMGQAFREAGAAEMTVRTWLMNTMMKIDFFSSSYTPSDVRPYTLSEPAGEDGTVCKTLSEKRLRSAELRAEP